MTPQINSNNELTEIVREPNKTYRINERNIDGKIEGLESVKQSIYHILSTERYSNPIYDDDYGVELEQYLGKDIGYVRADIERTLIEALTQDDRITNVKVDSVTQKELDSCLIKFTVYTIYGNTEEELNVLQ